MAPRNKPRKKGFSTGFAGVDRIFQDAARSALNVGRVAAGHEPLPPPKSAKSLPYNPETGTPRGLEMYRTEDYKVQSALKRAEKYSVDYGRKGQSLRDLTVNQIRQVKKLEQRTGVRGDYLRKQIEQARRDTSYLKEHFAKKGLYAGNFDPEWDPLLKRSARIEHLGKRGKDKEVAAEAAALTAGVAARNTRNDLAEQQRAKRLRTQLLYKHAKMIRLGASGALGVDSETQAFLQNIDQLLRSADGWKQNPQAIIQAAQFLPQFVEANRDPGGFAGVLKDISEAPGIGHVLRAADAGIEQFVMQPLYASQLGTREGRSVGRGINSFVSALPGLGFLAGGVSARDRKATDTREEREELRGSGRLKSLGETYAEGFGLDARQLSGAQVGGFRPFGWMGDTFYSGAIDAGIQAGLDPLNVLTAGTAGAARLGENLFESAARATAREEGLGLIRAGLSDADALIKKAGDLAAKGLDGPAADAARQAIAEQVRRVARESRLSFLDNTRRGQSIVKAVEDVIPRVDINDVEGAIERGATRAGLADPASIQKAIPGLDRRLAQQMADASTHDEALNVFKEAFATGEYSPSMSVRRQMMAGFSDKAASAPSGIGLGKRVVRQQEGLFDLGSGARKTVRDKGTRSVVRASSMATAQAETVAAGLARAGVRRGDALQAIAAGAIGVDEMFRLSKVWDTIAGDAGLENLFESNLKRVEKEAYGSINSGLVGDKALEAALKTDGMKAFLEDMELLAALKDGWFGPEAAEQVSQDALFGIKRKFQNTQRLMGQALRDTASTLPARSGTELGREESQRFLSARVATAARNGDISERVGDALQREIERTAGLKNNKFSQLERRIEAALQNNLVGEELDRLLRNRDVLANATEAVDPVGLGRRLMNQPVRLFNSLAEPVSPAKVNFLGYTNEPHAVAARVEAVDRWLMGLDVDDFTRRMVRTSVEGITDENSLFAAVDQSLRLVAARHGVEPEALTAIQREGLDEVKAGTSRITGAFALDGSITTTDEVQTLAQKGEVVFLPDPEDVKRTLRELKAQQGDLLAKLRVGISNRTLDASAFGLKGFASGEDLTIRDLAKAVHRKWKYLTVVPGFELAALGAVVGYTQTDGDFQDKLKGAGQAASIGLLSPLRYVVRVGGIEEGLRKYLSEGLNAEVFKPHLSKRYTQAGLDRPFTLHNAVKAGDPIGTDAHRLMETAAKEWGVRVPKGEVPIVRLRRKDTRYLEGYGRIINQHVHPETDAVAEMMLRRQAGEIGADEAIDQFNRFIDSEAGKLWLRRMHTSFKGPKDAAEAFARYDNFFRTYVADPDVARARLDLARDFAEKGWKGEVPKDVLKKAQRDGTLPEVIHAENTFRVPKNFKQVALLRSRFTSALAFEGPTTKFNRVPMAKAIYRDEYTRLLREGVEGRRAQEIAEQLAVNKTNKVMFRIDDESRFAAKSDYAFPFQQPREELLRVWLPLITSHPARALHMTRLGAVAFNNGKENGMITQDRWGNWRMTVPGSAYLSKLLFNTSTSFSFSPKDLVFFGQGAYGVNIIPSPGGPYWSIASRMLINNNPEWFEGLADWQREILFPYGATGRIFRPEVSRIWQAWTGEPAPWEFASRQEQENALNNHRMDIELMLRWKHMEETGDADWRPSEEMVDDALKTSLKAWAFMGATFPASPGMLRPDQDAFDVAKQAYTDEFGNTDLYALINDHPRWAPWITPRYEYADDGSFEAWARTQLDSDTLTHRRTTKDWAVWRKEIDGALAESKAYKQKADIPYTDREDPQGAYLRWDEEHPELAARSRDNYQRDMELMHIEATFIGAKKEEQLNIWRRRHNVSFGHYKTLAGKVKKNTLRSTFDPWDTARTTRHIVKDVQRELNARFFKMPTDNNFEERFAAESRIVADLPVVEQYKYWQARQLEFDFQASSDPRRMLDQYWLVRGKANDLWKTPVMQLHLAQSEKKKKAKLASWSEGAEAVAGYEQREDEYREFMSSRYDEIARLEKEADILAEKAQSNRSLWKQYYAIKDKTDALYDDITRVKNEWFRSMPDLEQIAQDVMDVTILLSRGKTATAMNILRDGGEYKWFRPSDEESGYLNMTAEVKDAYLAKLVEGLSIEGSGYVKGRLFWDWLTDFQKSVLRSNLPSDQIEDWMAKKPNGGGGGGGGGRRGRGGGGGELGYAYAMFKQYNQRGGMKAPAAYKQYLELPPDSALRSAFLKQHPEVADYISKGPMANMPPVIAMIVADIMIRNGKWEGESRSMTEITEIAFAREQMARWSKRGEEKAPESLQAWIDMPTGVEKAQYLKDHPEIQRWLQLGPMANMPEAYREVVRDIMTRYGIWTASQDPLGQVITGYYSTPSYARDAYLEQHPELVEYWKATRDPEKEAMYSLADQYFSISDPTAQRMFLQVNPALQQWFVDQRSKKFENFLNRVAVYMGSNPELFEKYLERQEDIMSDLLHKFSEAPMVRERFVTKGVTPTKKRQRNQGS